MSVDAANEPLLLDEGLRLANPTDHLGRTAKDIDELLTSGADVGEMLCPECRSPMAVRGGDRIVKHFYHVRGNATRNCGGARETAWHLFCKYAARAAGWSNEHTLSLPCGTRRADAYMGGRVLEFVHSLSGTYETKHRQLAAHGYECRWLFDSAASFRSAMNSEQFDFGVAGNGPLRVRGLFKRNAVSLIDSIGHAHCYVYYRWLVWRCVGRDEWEILPQEHELQNFCTMDGGLNYEIILGKFHSDKHNYRVDIRPWEWTTNWRTQVEYVIQDLFGIRGALAAESSKIARALASRTAGRELAPQGYGPGVPVCSNAASGRYLSLENIQAIVSEALNDNRAAGDLVRYPTTITSSSSCGRFLSTAEYSVAFVEDVRWVSCEGGSALRVALIESGVKSYDVIDIEQSPWRFRRFCIAAGVDSVEIRRRPQSASAVRVKVKRASTNKSPTVIADYLPAK